MEILGQEKGKVQVASYHYILLILIILFACSSSKNIELSNSGQGKSYEVIRLKSKDGGSYITIGSYHFEDKQDRAPAFYYINNVAIDPTNKLKDTTITVQPGEFRVRGRYISKLETVLDKLTVTKGDSVYIKLYLKDDPEPLR